MIVTTLQVTYYYYTHFIYENIDVESQGTCPRQAVSGGVQDLILGTVNSEPKH